MTLDEWQKRWTLNGDHLHCVCCKVVQWPYNAARPFPHEANCANQSEEDQHPWRDLARIFASDQQA
jgi:hypothetical protein